MFHTRSPRGLVLAQLSPKQARTPWIGCVVGAAHESECLVPHPAENLPDRKNGRRSRPGLRGWVAHSEGQAEGGRPSLGCKHLPVRRTLCAVRSVRQADSKTPSGAPHSEAEIPLPRMSTLQAARGDEPCNTPHPVPENATSKDKGVSSIPTGGKGLLLIGTLEIRTTIPEGRSADRAPL
jgi:hypothetical protein